MAECKPSRLGHDPPRMQPHRPLRFLSLASSSLAVQRPPVLCTRPPARPRIPAPLNTRIRRGTSTCGAKKWPMKARPHISAPLHSRIRRRRRTCGRTEWAYASLAPRRRAQARRWSASPCATAARRKQRWRRGRSWREGRKTGMVLLSLTGGNKA